MTTIGRWLLEEWRREASAEGRRGGGGEPSVAHEPPVGQPLPVIHQVLPLAGRLWGAGRPGYPDEPPSAPAMEAGVHGWRELGVERVVSLIQDWELPSRAPGLFEALGARKIAVARLPIRDFGVPTDTTVFARLLADIRQRLATGDGVLIHCNAGLGRTAVVLAALLRIHGFDGDPVVEIRRIYRRGAMEDPVQEAFVRGLDPAFADGADRMDR